MITEQEYQDLLLKNAKEYQRACELQRENNKLKSKLKIAEEVLDYYAELYIDTDICDDQFFGADAVDALQKIKEVDNE